MLKPRSARALRLLISAVVAVSLLILFSFIVPAESIGAETEPTALTRNVWASPSGAKYHLRDCSALRGESARLTLEEALGRGLEPCKLCGPPVPSSGPALFRVDEAELGRSSSVPLGRLIRAEVYAVVDGDTVKAEIDGPRPPGLKERETIRLSGVDAPETSSSPRPQGYFGREAAEYARSRLEGKPALLAFDRDLRDGYGRLLAYLYLEEGECFNLTLVSLGYARAYLRYPFAFSGEFEEAGKKAEKDRRGLWAGP